jgi:hypothetical protein
MLFSPSQVGCAPPPANGSSTDAGRIHSSAFRDRSARLHSDIPRPTRPSGARAEHAGKHFIVGLLSDSNPRDAHEIEDASGRGRKGKGAGSLRAHLMLLGVPDSANKEPFVA